MDTEHNNSNIPPTAYPVTSVLSSHVTVLPVTVAVAVHRRWYGPAGNVYVEVLLTILLLSFRSLHTKVAAG